MPVEKHPAQVRCEEFQARLADEGRYLRNRIIEIWNILNPTKNAGNDLKLASYAPDNWATASDDAFNNEPLREQLTDLFRQLHERFRHDIIKADQLITQRNNELQSTRNQAEHTKQSLDSIITSLRSKENDHLLKIKELERVNQSQFEEMSQLRLQTQRERSSLLFQVKEQRAALRVLVQELAESQAMIRDHEAM